MRKNILLNDPPESPASEGELTAVNSPSSPTVKPPPLHARGAVGAMRETLAQMAGVPGRDAVVEVDPGQIDDSPVPDRTEGSQAHHDLLVAAIRDQGQLVPVLLRPKARDPGRYQVAYGHRRVRALRELARPVRAVVREMTDEELVLAQGQENNARRDLSFIEKATFAVALEDRGFDREKVIAAALSVDKTELSRLVSVARSIPPSVIAAIGPAPKAGRGRWMDLATRLAPGKSAERARRFISDEFTTIIDSDERFVRLLAALTSPPPSTKPRIWSDPDGRRLARIERGQGRFVLSIDEKLEPEFGDYLERRLPEIFRAFTAGKSASTAFHQPKKEG